jgi:hypothetical protein
LLSVEALIDSERLFESPKGLAIGWAAVRKVRIPAAATNRVKAPFSTGETPSHESGVSFDFSTDYSNL